MVRETPWPDKVVPADGEQGRRATEALFREFQWNEPRRSSVLDYLQRWYDAGWSPQAVKVALQSTPDGAHQRPRGPGEDVEHFLKDRLRPWYADEADSERGSRRAPPRQGMDYQQWWRIAQADRERSGVRRRQRLGRRGRRAREQARRQASTARKDALTRGAEKDARIAGAFASLDDLLSSTPGGRVPTGGAAEPAAAPRSRSRMAAAYAGRRSTISQHPTIRRIVQRLVDEDRRPGDSERQVLRNALSEAKAQAALGTLEASCAAETGEELSDSARRILGYLDHAGDENVPLEALLVLLDRHTARPRGG
ncbi:hypothetical protein [Salinifilum ghardaiensis]